MARGELDPADALAAGRVRVRGDLAALVAGQDVLAAAAARLGTDLEDLTDPPNRSTRPEPAAWPGPASPRPRALPTSVGATAAGWRRHRGLGRPGRPALP